MPALDTDTLAAALRRVARDDAVALPLLAETDRRTLLASTETLRFRPATPEVGPAQRRVYQDFELCYDVPAAHELWRLVDTLGSELGSALREVAPGEADSFTFNDLIVQRYPPGCRGITAHRDHVRYRLVVAIVLLEGDGEFCVCTDRAGDNERRVDFGPGDVLLMRAPGLGRCEERPFHLMRGVTRRRVTIGLRFDARA